MPHFVLEYSDNLGENKESIQGLFAELHKTADESGLFPLKGLRSRGYCCENHRMADGNPQHGFAHLEVKIGVGRSMEDKSVVAGAMFKVLTEHFADQVASRGMALSFEMKELEPVLKFNKNNVADYL